MSVVNLNKTRKVRARARKKARATENAVKFGRTKSEKATQRAQETKAISRIDAFKRDT